MWSCVRDDGDCSHGVEVGGGDPGEERRGREERERERGRDRERERERGRGSATISHGFCETTASVFGMRIREEERKGGEGSYLAHVGGVSRKSHSDPVVHAHAFSRHRRHNSRQDHYQQASKNHLHRKNETSLQQAKLVRASPTVAIDMAPS